MIQKYTLVSTYQRYQNKVRVSQLYSFTVDMDHSDRSGMGADTTRKPMDSRYAVAQAGWLYFLVEIETMIEETDEGDWEM